VIVEQRLEPDVLLLKQPEKERVPSLLRLNEKPLQGRGDTDDLAECLVRRQCIGMFTALTGYP
jgi:hypothetical protein